MNKIRSLLWMTSRQRELCTRLEASRNRLYRMAFSWSHDADVADEVVQETMIKALNNIDRINDPGAMDGWLFRIMSNCFYDHCRKQRDTVDIDDIVLSEHATPESVNSEEEMLVEVRTAIAALPLKHRQVVTLVDLESCKYAEVADILDIPIGTVMSRLNRARQKLREQLAASAGADNKVELKVVR